MDAAFHILPTPAGLVLAAIAVALGAPLFSDGLRALRLRRQLAKLSETPLTPSSDGFSHARGTVVLESPLFSPIGGQPCAGFQLEVVGEGRAVRRVLEERRPFRIVSAGIAARIPAAAGRWNVGATSVRRVAPGDALSEKLRDLLGRVPEAAWLRRAGVTLELTERALLAGQECHVVGTARSAGMVAYAEAPELARTGTDDAFVGDLPEPYIAGARGSDALAPPPVTFTGGEHLDFLLVTDSPPAPGLLRISAWRVAGIVLGPILSLAGIFYLAAVADALRASGRM